MSPLQKVAMGLLVVALFANFPPHPDPAWRVYDALPNPLGWVLVLVGMIQLRRVQPLFGGALWAAAVSLVVSVPLWLPQLAHRMDHSGLWATSLPQLLFCFLLSRSIARLAGEQHPPDRYAGSRFALLAWIFAVLAVLPVLVFGGGLRTLGDLTELASMLAALALVWFCFAVHRRPWLAGPGPREVTSANQLR